MVTEKLNQEIKIKAKQVTEDLINFMQELDTENNHQIKELQKDIEYYKSHVEELETELTEKNEQIKDFIKFKETMQNELDEAKELLQIVVNQYIREEVERHIIEEIKTFLNFR